MYAALSANYNFFFSLSLSFLFACAVRKKKSKPCRSDKRKKKAIFVVQGWILLRVKLHAWWVKKRWKEEEEEEGSGRDV